MTTKRYEENVLNFYNEMINKIVSVLDPETIVTIVVPIEGETQTRDEGIKLEDIASIFKIIIRIQDINAIYSQNIMQFIIELNHDNFNVTVASGHNFRKYILYDNTDTGEQYRQTKHWYCYSEAKEQAGIVNETEGFEEKVEALLRILADMPPILKPDLLSEIVKINKKLDTLIKLLGDRSNK